MAPWDMAVCASLNILYFIIITYVYMYKIKRFDGFLWFHIYKNSFTLFVFLF